MEVQTCKACGKLFNYIRGERICPMCKKELEERFKDVKKFVNNNPGAGMNEISKAMDVSVMQIQRWVREERLCFTADSMVGIPCESCGATIRTGRYCDKCKSQLENNFRQASGIDEQKKPTPEIRKAKENKMRFLDN